MYVVCVHPDNHPTAFVDPVPVMEAETESLMEEPTGCLMRRLSPPAATVGVAPRWPVWARSVERRNGLAARAAQDQRRRYDQANVCLVRALRSLGLAVQFSGPGPFRARTDGNRFLAPLGLGLRYTDSAAAGPGRYVLWQNGHFVAVHIAARVTITDGSRRPMERHCGCGEWGGMRSWRVAGCSCIAARSTSRTLSYVTRKHGHASST
jgi:hypothetical protein